jgi:hypothetical protein
MEEEGVVRIAQQCVVTICGTPTFPIPMALLSLAAVTACAPTCLGQGFSGGLTAIATQHHHGVLSFNPMIKSLIVWYYGR